MTTLFPMQNRVQAYAWGSHTALAQLRGEAKPSTLPEAELWMGAHPLAPSALLTADGPRSLLDLVTAQPESLLGAAVTREFGALPFLMKLLAAREPLSLQAHPSAEQARAGFAREEAAGVALSSPQRSYKDPHHKPELIAALTPFSALVGFRSTRDTARLFAGLGVSRLTAVTRALAEQPPNEALRALFDLVTSSAPTARHELATETFAACRKPHTPLPDFASELAWGVRIGELYPGDAGLVLALALNLVVLEPNQALYLPAGNLHAYLEGMGVELMASSDNVLRGGLTPKHVDAAELAARPRFHSRPRQARRHRVRRSRVPLPHEDARIRPLPLRPHERSRPRRHRQRPRNPGHDVRRRQHRTRRRSRLPRLRCVRLHRRHGRRLHTVRHRHAVPRASERRLALAARARRVRTPKAWG